MPLYFGWPLQTHYAFLELSILTKYVQSKSSMFAPIGTSQVLPNFFDHDIDLIVYTHYVANCSNLEGF